MPSRSEKGTFAHSLYKQTYYADPRSAQGYNNEFPVSMKDNILESDRDGNVKLVEVDIDDDITEEVEIDEAFGPKIIPAKEGETIYIATWPSMTSSEKKVCLHMVAKRNYKTKAGALSTVNKTWFPLAAGEATIPDVGSKFPEIPGDVEQNWLTVRPSFGALTGVTSLEDQLKPRRSVAAAMTKAKERDPQERPYDIIIYGATGFTGSLMAEHLDALLKKGGSTVTWAIAGRSENKLDKIAKRCKTTPGVIRAASDEDLMSMASQGKIVINSVGPYFQLGEPVIKACVEKLTHYIDVTGETPWVKSMIEKYHETAREKGIAIVHGSGQVSAPDEINCYLLAQRLGPLKSFREYAFQYGAQTGGSVNTSIQTLASFDPKDTEANSDPFIIGGQRARDVCDDDRDCTEALADVLYPSLFHQVAYGGVSGARYIRRSCQLFEDRPGVGGPRYGDSLVVTIRDLSQSQKAAAASLAQPGPTNAEEAKMASSAMQDQVNQGAMPAPGEGPPAEYRAHMFSDFYGVAESESGRWAYVHYTGPEAYEVTAMAAVTGALVLVDELPKAAAAGGFAPVKEGGVLSPAFAFHGTPWIFRLQANAFANGRGRKMKFEVKEGKPSEEELKSALSEKTKKAMNTEGLKAEGKITGFALPALLA